MLISGNGCVKEEEEEKVEEDDEEDEEKEEEQQHTTTTKPSNVTAYRGLLDVFPRESCTHIPACPATSKKDADALSFSVYVTVYVRVSVCFVCSVCGFSA